MRWPEAKQDRLKKWSGTVKAAH